MDTAFAILLAVIVLALAFDYVNGFHDTANAIATVVATRVLSPVQAILMAATLNFVGALSGTAVATTVGKGIIEPGAVTQQLVISALLSAIVWDLVTWYYGIPSSSSHALVFSIVGAGIASGGMGVLGWVGIEKVLAGLITSPMLGLASGFLFMVLLFQIFARMHPSFVSRFFGRAQLLSSLYMAFSHGSNDAQKTMGVITMSLAAYYGWTGDNWEVPLWVIVAAATAMGLGTASGGWRIIKTMGHKIVELKPIHGFAAETTAATIIELATRLGIPISTTHVISSTIMGVGATGNRRAVRWGVAGNIVTAWIVTIPACVAMGWLFSWVLHFVLP
ncbi:MAG: inorganic phosphate transporter [Chloroflexi bacterium]|nr:inorganic phosphate transporter [Chloroflexota bacterium]